MRTIFPLAVIIAVLAQVLARVIIRFGFSAAVALAVIFFIDVDVKARGEHVAPGDFGRRTGRLQNAQNAEIVLGMLQVVFRQHPVAGRSGVAGQLTVLVIDVLGVTADLHIVRAVGIKGAIDVLARLATGVAAAAAAIATALPFHSLEVSHAPCRK